MNKFLFSFNKDSYDKRLFISGKEVDINDNFDFKIGYDYDHDGEYIKINIIDNSVEISTDLYSSHPVYLYEDGNSIIVSSLLVDVVNHKDTNILNKSFELIDARGRERFLGLQQEARKELRNIRNYN